MAKEIYLTQYGLMAERHWREFRPKMMQELEAKGTLMALFESAGEDDRRNRSSHPAVRNGAEVDSAAGSQPSLGDDSGEIHSLGTGRESLFAVHNAAPASPE